MSMITTLLDYINMTMQGTIWGYLLTIGAVILISIAITRDKDRAIILTFPIYLTLITFGFATHFLLTIILGTIFLGTAFQDTKIFSSTITAVRGITIDKPKLETQRLKEAREYAEEKAKEAGRRVESLWGTNYPTSGTSKMKVVKNPFKFKG